MRDYRDDVIEELANSEAAIRAELMETRTDRDAYRAVAVVSIHHAHDLQTENRRLRRHLDALREQVRRLRDANLAPGDHLSEAA